MSMMLVGIVIMFGASLVSRLIQERSLQLLSPEQKVSLVDSFSRSRVIHLAAVFSVIAIYVVVVNTGMSGRDAYLPALIVPLGALMAWSHFVTIRKLRALAIPDAYVRTFHRARLLTYAGWVTFIVLAVVGFSRP